ncbi:MAG: ferrous iron transport protein B [Candidatus Bipolaricaulota bacterium]|nr:ferrous iron transport protein B [Candidatus Bipolaricaulota bacterium]
MIRIALVGQPNSGKSTIFNHLVGYKANTSNLPGTTVEYMKSSAMIGGKRAEVVDLPGTYSLTSVDEAEAQTRNFLVQGEFDAVLNVIDASLLSRGLELTMQVLEMGIPLVVCLNMEDEARRKGLTIDVDALSEQLGVPVVSAIAVRGVGVKQAAASVMTVAKDHPDVPAPKYSSDVEKVVEKLSASVASSFGKEGFSPRLMAIKLLEGDQFFIDLAREGGVDEFDLVDNLRVQLAQSRGRSGEEVLAAERHHLSMELFEDVTTIGSPTIGLRDRVDALLMHPFFGYIFFAAIMYGFFLVVFRLGALVEAPIMDLFDSSVDALATVVNPSTIWFFMLRGTIQGVAGAVGIVLPYLIPFLTGLAVLEDVGYLPRAGYLMDVFMHKIGLHGKSVIPFITGYGCSVPAVMATRILDSPRDRFITATLAVMVPCVARTTVIFGLIGYFLGPTLAFLLYIINILVIAIAGKVMTKIFPQVTPGLILEIPSYKVPSVRVVWSKVWLRAREFIVLAWPLLIGGSVLLSIFEYVHISHYLNLLVFPITWALGLPLSLGVTLIFGIFRKELTLIMLFQALGTTQVASVLSAGQMMTFTLFVLFYIPCVATIAVLIRELGSRKTALVLTTTTGIAMIVALIGRGIAGIIG